MSLICWSTDANCRNTMRHLEWNISLKSIFILWWKKITWWRCWRCLLCVCVCIHRPPVWLNETVSCEIQEQKCQAVRSICCAEAVETLNTKRPGTAQSYTEATIRHLEVWKCGTLKEFVHFYLPWANRQKCKQVSVSRLYKLALMFAT